MRSKSITIFATVAFVSIAVYIVAAFLAGNAPDNLQDWITFSLVGLVIAAATSAIFGSLVVLKGRKTPPMSKERSRRNNAVS